MRQPDFTLVESFTPPWQVRHSAMRGMRTSVLCCERCADA
jgi:hypothetical protein